MASRTEKMQDILRGLRGASPDIIGAAVVSIDGFIVASVLPSEVDEELVSGMAAAMLGVGERISSELMASTMEQVYVRSENPRGETGYYLVSDGTEKPLRLKIRTGSFSAMNCFEKVTRGLLIGDVVAVIGSFDIILPEVDR